MSTSEHNDEPPPSSAQGYLLLNILWTVVCNIRIVALIAGLSFITGALFAFLPAPQFTSTSKVIRGVQADGPVSYFGGLSLLRGFGVNLGVNSVGLGPEAYPGILMSREVRLAVVRDSFFFNELGKSTTYVEYANQSRPFDLLKRYTIGLPSTIWAILQATESVEPTSKEFPSREETIAMQLVLTHVKATIDAENGFMNISVATSDPQLSASLNTRFVEKLVVRVEEIRTLKAQKNLDFIEERLSDATGELVAAEDALSLFNDRNMSMQSARLRTERERLDRRVTFKTDLYNDLRVQLTQAKIDLGRSMSSPIITILDRPIAPINPSGPPRKMIFIISVTIGLLLGITVAYSKEGIMRKMAAHNAELHEIKEALNSLWPSMLRRLRKRGDN